VSKLYFRYGSMKSSKTLQLLSVKTSYEKQGKVAFCCKPDIDTRSQHIKSRMLEESHWANMIIRPTDGVDHFFDRIQEYMRREFKKQGPPHVVLVDEAQFLSKINVDALRAVSKDCPVICYGLRSDFMSNLFEGSRRLFEVADQIDEIKNVCYEKNCNRKATMNLRHNPTGPQIVIGDEEYSPACWWHWEEHMREFIQTPKGEK